MQHIKLHIQGMTCCGCAKSITRVLLAINGVQHVDIDWQNAYAEIHFDPTQTNANTLIDAIENAGFEAQA